MNIQNVGKMTEREKGWNDCIKYLLTLVEKTSINDFENKEKRELKIDEKDLIKLKRK